VRGRAGDDADPPGTDPPGTDQTSADQLESIAEDVDMQDAPPASVEPQEDIQLHTQQQDTAMDASTTMQTAQQTYDKLIGTSREQIEKANQAMLKASEEMQKLSKENVEACLQASTIIAKGMQELGREWTAYLQESLERAAAATKALMAARTMQEVVALQSDWVKGSLDKLVAEATKLSEQTVKVTNEAMEPISARLTVAAEKLRMPLAA
jgi:phasin family protein